ncbi:MAG: SHOCT domain-containing protein [Thermomicrobiales bacterium]|nr:SHOCT domain-containing protein [Thermomicrobiales bacterium]
MMNGWGMTGWGWGWMTIWWLLAIVIIALLVAAALRNSSGARSAESPDSALAVLRRRYAAGEIDEAEFRRRRAELEGVREEDLR